jgi:hypothetical protein
MVFLKKVVLGAQGIGVAFFFSRTFIPFSISSGGPLMPSWR